MPLPKMVKFIRTQKLRILCYVQQLKVHLMPPLLPLMVQRQHNYYLGSYHSSGLPKFDTVAFCLWNASSLVNKLNYFQCYIYSSEFQIIAITETWFRDYNLNNEILPSNFTICRNDFHSSGVGVMLAIDDTITSSLIESHNTLEAITVSVSLHNKQIVICLLYIPPKADQDYHLLFLLICPHCPAMNI